MNFDLKPFMPETMYRRNGLECYLCQSRKKLIQQTPKEKVRQALIKFLIEKLKTPSDRILVEVPMSHYLKSAKGRADIVVNDKNGKPALIIECKEGNQFLSDEAISQAKRYNYSVQASAIMVTNGLEYYYALFDNKTGSYQQLSKIPSYRNLTKWKWFSFSSNKLKSYPRPFFRNPIPKSQIDHCLNFGWLGEDTPETHYSLIFNLLGWMFDWEDKVRSTSFKEINVIEDAGMRYSQYGNAGGGAFGGEYRYFILRDGMGNN